jgi:hydrogenase-1 operon protein HyaF
MPDFKNIAIHVENPPETPPGGVAFSTGNATPLLNEIRHALARLLETGEETVIDLNSLPMAQEDMDQLLQILGQGELQATLDALGESHIRETECAGVWVIEHFDAEDRRVGFFIEITTVPSIIKSQVEDMEESLTRLEDQLRQKLGG